MILTILHAFVRLQIDLYFQNAPLQFMDAKNVSKFLVHQDLKKSLVNNAKMVSFCQIKIRMLIVDPIVRLVILIMVAYLVLVKNIIKVGQILYQQIKELIKLDLKLAYVINLKLLHPFAILIIVKFMTTMISLTVLFAKMDIFLINKGILIHQLVDIKIFAFLLDEESPKQISIKACLDGFVDLITGNCVPNCGVGRYGNVTFGYKGMIESTICLECDSSCFECSSKYKCISCKQGYYLNTRDGEKAGICLQKLGKFEGELYVQSNNQSSGILQDGSLNYPFYSIIGALQKAYELGSPYNQSTIRIYLFSNQTHSMLRYNSKMKIFEKFDDQQTTMIILDTVDSIPTKVYYKLRDKFKFQVGAGLIIRNIMFDATDSIIDIRGGNIDLSSIESQEYQCLEDFSSSCCQSEYDFDMKRYTIIGPSICQNNFLNNDVNDQLEQQDCTKRQGFGSFFEFDVGLETMLSSPPILKLEVNPQIINHILESRVQELLIQFPFIY
ncbi:UNKNOWN [Stylonychia lemnae]|uniref:Uncharacterized protein n=1 Tax=Stylonychia lemnae TaxID=5949 RepID=A0A078BAK0_STYLE|nr:UNKNOWN [Stylonychia lemnae]|eukprot:CDW91590.1 UNKNOWN [Stylonychia lemnae]